MPKISEYPSALTIHANDKIDKSNTEDGGTTFNETQSLTFTQILDYINTNVDNIYNSDGVLPKDRFVDLSSFRLNFEDGDVLLKSDLLDVSFGLYNSSIVDRVLLRHDVGVDSGELIIKNSLGEFFTATDGVLQVANEIEFKKISGLGTIGKIGHNILNYSILFDSGTSGVILNSGTGQTVSIRINNDEKWNFDLDKITSNDGIGMKIETYNGGGSIYGLGVQASTFESIIPSGAGIKFEWGQGLSGALTSLMALSNDGVLNIPLMPTSSAGLSAGDLWSDSGTIKIV
jgi:hypothetical protein